MKSLATILFFIGLAFVSGLQCPKFECSTFAEKSECSQVAIDTGNPAKIKLRKCENENQVCDIKFSTQIDHCVDAYTLPLRYPGESCKNDTECFSSICKAPSGDSKEDVCIGIKENEKCNSDIDCDNGLFCNHEKICVKVSQTTCGVEKCAASFVCNNKQCVKFGSLPLDSPSSVAFACSTFFISNGKCAEGPHLVRKEGEETEGPIKCPGICKYKLKNEQTFFEPCQCGRTKEGDSFCNPGKGELTSFISDFKEYLDTDTPANCHISKGPLCQPKPIDKMGKAYLKALVGYNKITRWGVFINNEECVKTIMAKDYWYLENHPIEEDDKFGFYLFISVTVLAVVIVAIVSVIIYFRSQKSDEEETTTGGVTIP